MFGSAPTITNQTTRSDLNRVQRAGHLERWQMIEIPGEKTLMGNEMAETAPRQMDDDLSGKRQRIHTPGLLEAKYHDISWMIIFL